MNLFIFICQQTLIFLVPLLLVGLGDLFSERSGVLNIALEGIMVFGAFAGIMFIRSASAAMPSWLVLLIAILISILAGILLSSLHAFASIHLKAEQTISSTAIITFATAFCIFYARVMLGTDGMHSDMIRSAQSSYFIAGLAEGGMSPLAAYQRLRAVHAHIQGHNAPGGGANNLVILNYDSPTPLTQDNFPGHFCYAFDARNVESVISQGRLIVDHGRLASMDEADILAYAKEQARRLWALL